MGPFLFPLGPFLFAKFRIGDGSFELQEPSPIRKNLAISLIIMYNSHIIKQWRHIMEKLLVRNLYKNTKEYENKEITIEGWLSLIHI